MGLHWTKIAIFSCIFACCQLVCKDNEKLPLSRKFPLRILYPTNLSDSYWSDYCCLQSSEKGAFKVWLEMGVHWTLGLLS